MIGFSKIEQCNVVKEIVTSHGFLDVTICQTGAEIVRAANNGAGGIVICAWKLSDMMYHEIYELLPREYGMLVLLSRNQVDMIYDEDIFSLVLPVNKEDLIKTIQMVLEIGRQTDHLPKKNIVKKSTVSKSSVKIERTGEDRKLIEKAKLYLMNKYKISEDTAHRFIQKSSMDNGMKMLDTAKIILKDE